MRIDGTLSKWNDDRGFGFITPTQGGADVFIHISALPRDGRRPQLGEPLSFEVETTADGKKRAKAVTRPGRPGTARHTPGPRSRRTARRSGFLGRILPLVVLVAIGAYGYNAYTERSSASASVDERLGSGGASAASASYRCDGRTHCSQMTSCAEAKYFLEHCPGVEMDGDGDGVPCEQQWCTGSFAK